MQRILLSLGMIVFVGALAAGATGAFFSDTETSTGNTFAAGDIDLQIDNESFALPFNIEGYEGSATSSLVFNSNTSWSLADLVSGEHKFFDFVDLKPGDYGEDTISIHVGSNDAWMCAAARITADEDNGINEPEADDDSATSTGELDEQLQIAFWKDDGDNVFEADEVNNIITSGLLSGLEGEGQVALADTSEDSVYDEPIPGNSTVYIGKAWCFGSMDGAPVAQDGFGSTLTVVEGVAQPGTGTNGPDVRGTGFTCDGSQLDNAAQTDILQGDMQFYAVQSRNNATFTCSEDYDPEWPSIQ